MGMQAECQDSIAGRGLRAGRGGSLLSALFAGVLSLGVSGGGVAADVAQVAGDTPVGPQAGSMDSKRPANDEPSAEDIELLADEVAAHVQRKQELENRLDSQQAGQDSLRLRLKESRNNIRIELDEVLQSSAPRTRLDNMLERHEAAREEEIRLAEALEETRAELAREQLQLVQKQRDLERMKARHASQQREKELRKVQELARQLERRLQFRETISFKCPSSKSLGKCLGEYPLEASIQGWVEEHYKAELDKHLEGYGKPVQLSPDWYTTRVTHEFTEASMTLQGTVTADVDVRVQVRPRKMMACAMLGATAELCEAQSVSLIVRSNKYGDQVLVNKKPYGSTPLSLMLDPGVYNIEVRYQGLTQKRTLTLDENRHINFVF